MAIITDRTICALGLWERPTPLRALEPLTMFSAYILRRHHPDARRTRRILRRARARWAANAGSAADAFWRKPQVGMTL